MITAVAYLGIRNLDSSDHDYQFQYTQSISVSGPGGLFVNAMANKNYGPAHLDRYGNPGDSIQWGPDTPFLDRKLSRTISNVAPYLGTGNVTLNFNNTGSTLLLQGSNNYQATITTFAWGEFRLVYYWCSANVLASGMKGFTASKKDATTVALQWTYENEPANNQYDVQVSRDGYTFTTIAKRNGSTGTQGVIQYDHQYSVMGDEGKLYFRIKALRPTGGIQYSPIRLVSFNGPGSYTISPNPVKKHASIAFARPQNGDFGVEIINAVGQSVYRKVHALANETLMEVFLPQDQAPGVYYLRINNLKTKEQFTQKILLQ